MKIIRKPSSNYYPNRYGSKPIGICDHITAGQISGVDAWFNNRASNASSTFCISRKGDIHQYVDIEHGAWTQGLTKDGIPYATAPLIKQMGINPNLYLVSIEHEGYVEGWKDENGIVHTENHGLDGDLTEEQFRATCWVHKYIQDYVMKKWKHKIDLNSYYVFGHNQVDPCRKPFCPGNKFPWARLYKELALADSMTFEQYEEHLAFISSPAYDRTTAYAFAERIQDLGKKLTGIWATEARRKLMLLVPILEELNYQYYEGDDITPENIVKRVLDIYKNSSDARFEGEAFRKLLLGAAFAKQVGILS